MTLAAILGLAKGAAGYWREIAIVALALGLLWYRGQYHDCKADRAADKAAQVQAVLEAQKKADTLSAELLTAQEQHKRELEEATRPVIERIVNLPVTTSCSTSPAMREAIEGTRSLLAPRSDK